MKIDVDVAISASSTSTALTSNIMGTVNFRIMTSSSFPDSVGSVGLGERQLDCLQREDPYSDVKITCLIVKIQQNQNGAVHYCKNHGISLH
jgi:hypothetical protein